MEVGRDSRSDRGGVVLVKAVVVAATEVEVGKGVGSDIACGGCGGCGGSGGNGSRGLRALVIALSWWQQQQQ